MVSTYKGYTIEYITKRTCYLDTLAPLAEEHSIKNESFPLFMGQVDIFKNGLVICNWVRTSTSWSECLSFYSTRMNEIRAAIDEVKDKINQVIGKAQAKDYSIYYQEFSKSARYSAILRGIDLGVLEKLKEFLSEEEIAIAAIFEEETMAASEERKILELAVKNMASEEKKKDLRKIYDEHKWMYYGLSDELPVSFEVYTKQFFNIKDPQQQLQRAQENKDVDLKKHNLLLNRLTAYQKELVFVAKQAAFLKDYNKMAMNLCLALGHECRKIIANNAGVSEENLHCLFPKEILSLIDGKKINFIEIKKRNANIILQGIPGDYKIFTGKSAEAFELDYLQRSKEENLKGRVASKGNASGKVCVVTTSQEFSKMQKGDILVVVNTTPDYVPIIKKAAAIIAEEGGITAHVSVISREFRIPCIVGVSRVTDTLKDGDFVEVDANTGIVKLLKNA